MKVKLTSGTQGVSTHIEEHKLNLAVSLLLRDELLSRGYSVLMIREGDRAEISNAERAIMANDAHANAFIRIHANGIDDPAKRGALTICQTKNNPDCGDLWQESRRLSDAVLDKYCAATGIRRLDVWETDTMTGINWCRVPVTILEMGFMSNAEEDELMATDAFRRSAAKSIADGVEAYFAPQIG